MQEGLEVAMERAGAKNLPAKPNRSRFEIPQIVSLGSAFRGLPESDVCHILEKASHQEFPAGRFLYMQGEFAHSFFVLESGLICLHDVTREGKRTAIRFVLPGEPIDYVAISEVVEYVLSAEILLPSKVWAWERDTAVQLVREIPGAAAILLNNMVRDVIYYHLHIRRLKADPLEQRIAWGLLELARAVGKSVSNGISIEYSGHRQLAELAGTTIYSVSRELSKLEHRGILRRETTHLLLLEPSRLLRGKLRTGVAQTSNDPQTGLHG